MAGDVIARLLSGYAFGVLCHRAYDKVLDAAEFGETANSRAFRSGPSTEFSPLAAASAC